MRFLLVFTMLAILGLFACAGPVSRPPVDVEAFILSSSLELAKPAQKALYNPITGDLFTLNTKDQEISIYQNGTLRNVVGGLGTGESNFLNLSDIAIAPDGAYLL
jgi:hypothetical protein